MGQKDTENGDYSRMRSVSVNTAGGRAVPVKGCNPSNPAHRQYCKDSCPCFCGAMVCMAVFFAVIFLPILFVKIIPEFAETTVTHTTIVLNSAMLSNGGVDTVTLDASLVIYETGILSGSIDATNAEVYDPHGRKMGTLRLPELNIKAGEPLELELSETFHCTDVPAFQASILELTKGNPQDWQLVADSTLRAKSIKLSVSLNKTLPLPTLGMIEPQVENFDFNTALMDFTFICLHTVSVEEIAWAQFNVSNSTGAVFATANVTNVSVRQGRNLMKDVQLLYNPSDPAFVEIGYPIINAYEYGNDSQLIMTGPIASSSPILNNIMDMDITMVGKKVKPQM